LLIFFPLQLFVLTHLHICRVLPVLVNAWAAPCAQLLSFLHWGIQEEILQPCSLSPPISLVQAQSQGSQSPSGCIAMLCSEPH
jgi:hypothetical protein